MQPFICLRANSEVQILSRLLRAPASGRLFATTAPEAPGPPANAPSRVASRMAAVGLPATRSHYAEWLFFSTGCYVSLLYEVFRSSVSPQFVCDQKSDKLHKDYNRHATWPSGLLPEKTGKNRTGAAAEVVAGNVETGSRRPGRA